MCGYSAIFGDPLRRMVHGQSSYGEHFLSFKKIFSTAPLGQLRAAARRTKYEDKDVKIGAGKVVGRCVAAVVRWPQT